MIDHSSIADLLTHPKVVETRDHLHHSIAKYDHLIRSVHYSYRLAPMMRADRRICMRAAILHDIDSRYGTLTTHGTIAARWAATQGECERVCTAIESHMYPLGPAPKTREAWVLVVADKLASLTDLTHFVGGLVTGKTIATRQRLRASDPFYTPRESLVRRWLKRDKAIA